MTDFGNALGRHRKRLLAILYINLTVWFDLSLLTTVYTPRFLSRYFSLLLIDDVLNRARNFAGLAVHCYRKLGFLAK